MMVLRPTRNIEKWRTRDLLTRGNKTMYKCTTYMKCR